MNKTIIILISVFVLAGITFAAFKVVIPLVSKDAKLKAAASGADEDFTAFWKDSYPKFMFETKNQLTPKAEYVHAQAAEADAKRHAGLISLPYTGITLESVQNYYTDFWLLSPEYVERFLEKVRTNMAEGQNILLTAAQFAQLNDAKDKMLSLFEDGRGDELLSNMLTNEDCALIEAKHWSSVLLAAKAEKGPKAPSLESFKERALLWPMTHDKRQMLINEVTKLYNAGRITPLHGYEAKYVLNLCMYKAAQESSPNNVLPKTRAQKADAVQMPLIDLDARYWAGYIKSEGYGQDIEAAFKVHGGWTGSDEYAKRLIPAIAGELKNKKFIPLTPSELGIRNKINQKAQGFMYRGAGDAGLSEELDEKTCADLFIADRAAYLKQNGITYQQYIADFYKNNEPDAKQARLLVMLGEAAKKEDAPPLKPYQQHALSVCSYGGVSK